MIDPFTIKPLDSKTIIDNAKATRGRIITVEDHYYEGKGTRTSWIEGGTEERMKDKEVKYITDRVQVKIQHEMG